MMRKLIMLLALSLFSFATISQASTLPLSIQQKQQLKKDGTPDKRFKANKPRLKKDGTPDKRYKSNKKA